MRRRAFIGSALGGLAAGLLPAADAPADGETLAAAFRSLGFDPAAQFGAVRRILSEGLRPDVARVFRGTDAAFAPAADVATWRRRGEIPTAYAGRSDVAW